MPPERLPPGRPRPGAPLVRPFAGSRRLAAPAGGAPAVASAARALPVEAAITRWAFYLYVAWIPLEYPDRSLPFDLGTLLGAVFLASTVFSFRTCYRRVVAPVVWYGLFLYAWVASFVVNGGQYAALVRDSFLRLVLLLLVLWASSNLLRNPRVLRTALLVLIASCTALALLQVTGVADMYGSDAGDGLRRATVLGQNPNRTGRFLAGAALAAVGLLLTGARLGRRLWPVAFGVVGLLAVAMVQGGSRGAMLTLVAGMLPFAIAARSFGARIRNGFVGALVVAGLVWAALQSPLMQKRLALAESGNLAKREEIFPAALKMVEERPLLGWAPIRTYYELGGRLSHNEHERRDTHNLVLELLTTTGVVGAVPAFLALALCFRAAWIARHGALGALPLAFMTQLLVGNMSGNFLSFKLYWLFQAIAIAAVSLPAGGMARAPARAPAPAAVAGGRRAS